MKIFIWEQLRRLQNTLFKIDYDYINSSYVFPPSSKKELLQILIKRNKLLTAYNDSIKLIHELRNKIELGELK